MLKKQIEQSKKSKKGFTLLELLIVIAIIAILSVVIVFVLNPAETLKKSRDSQRIADLNTLKTALGIYLTTVATPDLDAAINDCLGTGPVVTAEISYSKAQAADPVCAVDVVEGTDVTAGSTFDPADMCRATLAANNSLVDGTGWVPVAINSVVGGSPISNLPLDPVNSVSGVGGVAPVSTDLVYRYACQGTATSPAPSSVFEIDAVLESAAFGVGGTDDKSASDGGDNAVYYEVGTSLRLIGAGNNF